MLFYTLISRTLYTPRAKASDAEKSALPQENCYTIIDSKLKIINMTESQLVSAIINKKAIFVNIEYDYTKKRLVGSNGSLDRYMTFDGNNNNQLVNNPIGVILAKIEKAGEDDKTQYIVYSPAGTVLVMPKKQVVDLTKNGMIVNAKIRNTDSGWIVYPIKGQYPTYSGSTESKEIPAVELVMLNRYICDKKSFKDGVSFILRGKNAMDIPADMIKALRKASDSYIKVMGEYMGDDKNYMRDIQLKPMPNACLYITCSFDDALKIFSKCKVSSMKATGGKVMISGQSYKEDQTIFGVMDSHYKFTDSGVFKCDAKFGEFITSMDGGLGGKLKQLMECGVHPEQKKPAAPVTAEAVANKGAMGEAKVATGEAKVATGKKVVAPVKVSRVKKGS